MPPPALPLLNSISSFNSIFSNLSLLRIEFVSKLANLKDFIENELPLAYETKIGEAGVKLSGGQRQRLGIARALYSNPQVLIFDEATSALDTKTEKSLVHSLNNLKKDITVITITHRLSTIQNCDKIFEINNGEIIPIKT